LHNSLKHSADILAILVRKAARLNEISDLTGLSPSTAFKVLRGMAATGYAVKDPVTKHYVCGPLVVSLAAQANQSHGLLEICAGEEMSRVRDISRATVGISIRVGILRSVILERVQESTVTVSMHKAGVTAPIYTGASGLVLLSQMDAQKLLRLLDNVELLPLGPRTLTDRTALESAIDTVKERGYAFTSGTVSHSDSLAAVSVPITGYVTPLAMTIYGPRETFEPIALSFVGTLKNSANIIAGRLARYFSEWSTVTATPKRKTG
jgi:DNA-binding IclR family transcriptional regulator